MNKCEIDCSCTHIPPIIPGPTGALHAFCEYKIVNLGRIGAADVMACGGRGIVIQMKFWTLVSFQDAAGTIQVVDGILKIAKTSRIILNQYPIIRHQTKIHNYRQHVIWYKNQPRHPDEGQAEPGEELLHNFKILNWQWQ